MKPFTNPSVERAFAAYPPGIRKRLLGLRELILRTAAETEGVGELEETLKWGEPAYLTSSTGSGSTIRIDWKKKQPNEYAVYLLQLPNYSGRDIPNAVPERLHV
jgi:hypothetical protein